MAISLYLDLNFQSVGLFPFFLVKQEIRKSNELPLVRTQNLHQCTGFVLGFFKRI